MGFFQEGFSVKAKMPPRPEEVASQRALCDAFLAGELMGPARRRNGVITDWTPEPWVGEAIMHQLIRDYHQVGTNARLKGRNGNQKHLEFTRINPRALPKLAPVSS